MNVKSWFRKFKTSKKVETKVDVNPEFNIIMTFNNAVEMKSVPAGKYIFIDKMCRHTTSNNLERFIFKINENGSYKMDDIIYCGSIFTSHVTYMSGDDKFDAEVVYHIDHATDRLTLRDIRDNYFPNVSLRGSAFTKVYRLTSDNVFIKLADDTSYTLYYYNPSVNHVSASVMEDFKNTYCENNND